MSDHEVRRVIAATTPLPRTANEVYDCLGCGLRCGRCARTVKAIVDEALAAGAAVP